MLKIKGQTITFDNKIYDQNPHQFYYKTAHTYSLCFSWYFKLIHLLKLKFFYYYYYFTVGNLRHNNELKLRRREFIGFFSVRPSDLLTSTCDDTSNASDCLSSLSFILICVKLMQIQVGKNSKVYKEIRFGVSNKETWTINCKQINQCFDVYMYREMYSIFKGCVCN